MRTTFCAILILLVACAKKETKVIDNIFSTEFKEDEPGAAILLIIDGDTILKKGYGIADVATKEKVTPQTLFNTGSISKTFVSNTILSLAEEGKLTLNDSLSQYFPGFRNKSIAGSVKLRHLLSHTSGLPDNRRAHHDSIFLLTAKDQENWAPIELNDTLLFRPGTQFEYSNPAFNGLALIIEKVTTRKWQDVVRDKIFTPSHMPNSKITDGAFPEQGVAHGYLKSGDKFVEKDYGEEPTFAAAGNGGVWSSVEELARYEAALRNSSFLKKEVIDRSRSITYYPKWEGDRPPFIGYSWFITQSSDGTKIVSHTGTQGGFHADFVSIPERKFLYIILSSRKFPRMEFRRKILALIGLREEQVPIPK